MQEVEAAYYYSHYLPWFEQYGYKTIFKKRTRSTIDGCAIIFNTKKFKLVEQTSVEYFQPKAGNILNRDNIGLIAVLTPIAFYLPFCVTTTHLSFNPNRHDIKLAQVALLFTELDRICYKGKKNGVTQYLPIILSGDFNTNPSNSLIAFIKEGFLQYARLSKRNLDVDSHGILFRNELFPFSLGISECLQHMILEQNRKMEQVRGS